MAKTITTGDGTTHFVDINDRLRIVSAGPPVIALPPLKSGAIGAAMLFVPKAVFQVEQVPMLVYFHGHHGPNSIEGYVNQMPQQRDFRPLLAGEKVLLVEPQGGPYSNFGDLGTPYGLCSLIDGAMWNALLLGQPPRPSPVPTPKPPSLILAAYSGGGAALTKILLGAKADYANLISEVWCFDSMYSSEGAQLVQWANATKKTLRVRVSTEVANAKGSPAAQASAIEEAIKAARPSNIDIAKPVPSTHEGLPSKFIAEWLAPRR